MAVILVNIDVIGRIIGIVLVVGVVGEVWDIIGLVVGVKYVAGVELVTVVEVVISIVVLWVEVDGTFNVFTVIISVEVIIPPAKMN